MKRREFITLLGGAAAWPLAARAQQRSPMRRVGILMGPAEADTEGQERAAAFREALEKLGWTDGRNIQIDYRWAAGDLGRARTYASEIVALAPDAIMVNGTAQLAACQRATKSIPIVFAQVSDPVDGGFVASVVQPGGNITGFTDFEYSFAVKWLELLKEIAPDTTRVAVVFDSNNPNSSKFLPHIEAAQSSFGVSVSRVPIRDDAQDVGRAIDTFASAQPSGLVVLPNVPAIIHRDLIFARAARHRLPAMYPYRAFALGGGLTSYGVDVLDMYRGAASYVDRILNGERPANLPVQFATKFEFIINLKAAKAIGLAVPISMLLRASEVIE
jgi:putative ABC transport system substrate-binding protein